MEIYLDDRVFKGLECELPVHSVDILFLNQARRPQANAPGFYRLILSTKCVYVCVCVSTPEASNNQWRDVAWYGPHMIS